MKYRHLSAKALLKQVLSAVILIVTFSNSAVSGTYDYYPGSVLRLGGTFNPEDLTVAFPPCIAYGREFAVHRLNRDVGGLHDTLPPGQFPNVAAQNVLSIQQLRTRESLYSFLDISVAASGHYGFFSASASLHAQNEDAFDSDSFVFGVRGISTFGEIGLIDPRLTSDAKALVKNLVAFHQRCGREWVSEETRGVLIAVVYTIKNVSKSQRSLLEAAVSGGYNSPGLGIDISANMTKILQSAFTSNAYSATIHFIGGKGVSDFASTITQMDNPVAVLESIAGYMKTLEYINSVPLKFTTGSLDQFVILESPSGFFDSFNRRIGDLYLEYQDYIFERSKLWQFLHQDVQSTWGKKLDDQVWERLKLLDSKIQLLEAKAQVCRRSAQTAIDFVDNPEKNLKTQSEIKSSREKASFVKDFTAGISAPVVRLSSPNYSTTITALGTSANPPTQQSACLPIAAQSSEVEVARNALCSCLSDENIYVQSRFPLSAVPHIFVFHDHTLAPRSLLYVSVVSDADLVSAKLVDAQGGLVANLSSGFDPEQGPIWYSAILFRDGNGSPPSADKLPYTVQLTDSFGRKFTKPVIPLD